MADEPNVYVVDDDEESRESVCALVSAMGVACEAYASAEEFLAAYQPRQPACLVTDLRMPGMSGLELQETLASRGSLLPVIIITAYARTPLTVRAMQSGAVTLLDKPYSHDDLWDAIRAALQKSAKVKTQQEYLAEIRSRLERLTPEHRRVLELIIAGHPNKSIAQQLGLGLRTVESRRHDILHTMQAQSIAELVRMVVGFHQQSRPM